MSERQNDLIGRAVDQEHGGSSMDLTYGAKELFDVSVPPYVAMAVCSANHTGYMSGPPGGTVVGTFDTRAHVAGPSITHPEFERILSIAVDEKRQVVWVASGKAIFPIDTTKNNKVGSPIPMPDLALDIAIDANKDTGYVLATSFDADHATIVAFDLGTHQSRPFGATSSGVASNFGKIVVDEPTGTVFFSLAGIGFLFAIQLPGAAPVNIPIGGSGAYLATYSVDGQGFVFVNTPDGNRAITVVSPTSLQPVGHFFGPDAYALAVDKGLGALYMVKQELAGGAVSRAFPIVDILKTIWDLSVDPTDFWITYPDSVYATGCVAVDSNLHTAFVGAHHGPPGDVENKPAVLPIVPVGSDPVQITYPAIGSDISNRNSFSISGTGQQGATITGRLVSDGKVWAHIPSTTVDQFGIWDVPIQAYPPLGRMVIQIEQRYVLPGGVSQFWKVSSYCTVVEG